MMSRQSSETTQRGQAAHIPLLLVLAGTVVANLLMSCAPQPATNCGVLSEYLREWETPADTTVSRAGMHQVAGVRFAVMHDTVTAFQADTAWDVQKVIDRQWIAGNKIRIAVGDTSIRVWQSSISK